MSKENGTDDLAVLEARIDELINTIQRLSLENNALRDQQEDLISERAELIKTTEQARARIESMISRLRNMGT